MPLLTRHNGLGRADAAGLGEVGLDRDEVVGRLEAGPQPDSSATAPSSAVIDPTAFFMVSPSDPVINVRATRCPWCLPACCLGGRGRLLNLDFDV